MSLIYQGNNSWHAIGSSDVLLTIHACLTLHSWHWGRRLSHTASLGPSNAHFSFRLSIVEGCVEVKPHVPYLQELPWGLSSKSRSSSSKQYWTRSMPVKVVNYNNQGMTHEDKWLKSRETTLNNNDTTEAKQSHVQYLVPLTSTGTRLLTMLLFCRKCT